MAAGTRARAPRGWHRGRAGRAVGGRRRRAAADPAAHRPGHGPHATLSPDEAQALEAKSRRLGGAHHQPARRAAGADDPAGADRGVFAARGGSVEDRAAAARTTARCSSSPRTTRRCASRWATAWKASLTDVTSRRIIAETVAPLFRKGQFAAGHRGRRGSHHRGGRTRRAAAARSGGKRRRARRRDSTSARCCCCSSSSCPIARRGAAPRARARGWARPWARASSASPPG